MISKIVVLLLEGDLGYRRLIVNDLSDQGIQVVLARDEEHALDFFNQARPDVILINPNTFSIDLNSLIKDYGHLGILVLTTRYDSKAAARFLRVGADDYLGLPVDSDELAARILAIVRRVKKVIPFQVVRSAHLEVDLENMIVRKNGEIVPISRTEWQFLVFLTTNAGKTLTNVDILTRVWGANYRDDTQYLRVWVSKIRKKIELDPKHPIILTTQTGIGYRFELLPAVVRQEISVG